jgi:UDP:flavonoid glycosyltransferase YjiC (YdhE family)
VRVALVAGPDPGHAFPAIALARRFAEAGDSPVVFTGERWKQALADVGLEWALLPGLAPLGDENDLDAGDRLHARTVRMVRELEPFVAESGADFLVSDLLTACGGLTAERLGIPWGELFVQPMWLPSRGLPPFGMGLEPGRGPLGWARDVILRRLTASSIAVGERHRQEARRKIGLPEHGGEPDIRLIGTVPAFELPRPDWPKNAFVIGPMHFEPTQVELALPPGDGPVVMIAPSTASSGTLGLVDMTLRALDGLGVRAVVSSLDAPADTLPEWATAGLGRQDALLRHSSLLVCGSGHGIVSKAWLAGVPLVLVPGGGDQWELASRAKRQGSAEVIRPLTEESLRAAIVKVLGDPSYAASARAAGASVADVADPVALCRSVVAGTLAPAVCPVQ